MTNKDIIQTQSDGSGIAHIQVPTLLTDQNYIFPLGGGTILTNPALIGQTGSTGISGYIGATGLKGNLGNNGNTGFQGATGSTPLIEGPKGPTGNTGSTGIKGNTALATAAPPILLWQGSVPITYNGYPFIYTYLTGLASNTIPIYCTLNPSITIGSGDPFLWVEYATARDNIWNPLFRFPGNAYLGTLPNSQIYPAGIDSYNNPYNWPGGPPWHDGYPIPWNFPTVTALRWYCVGNGSGVIPLIHNLGTLSIYGFVCI